MKKSFKVFVVGNSKTGKSSMLNGLVNGRYDDEYVASKGLEPMSTIITVDDN